MRSYLKRRSSLDAYLKHHEARRKRHPNPLPPPPSTSWTVPGLCAAYGWPKDGFAGTGVIAIVELGGGWRQPDVDAAFRAMGLPAPSITDVSVDGTTNTPGSDADGEVALDIQVAGGTFAYLTGKAAEIRIYWARDIASAVRAATKDGCAACSISWGASESEWGTAALDDMEAAATAAVSAGMPVLAASGDNSADDGGGAAAVDAPASCPHVIGCGGTSTPAGDPETVWGTAGQPDGSGTGGGFSTYFPIQPWQVGIPLSPNGDGRMVPDIAANADPSTGYEIVLAGRVEIFGGTSAVSPLYSGVFAAADFAGGPDELWANPKAFLDTIAGSNGVYSQPPNPGPCSGLGRLEAIGSLKV